MSPIFKSKVMLDVVALARKAATTDVPVLLCGESGTGKEVIAKLIHESSACSAGPFVPINCAAIPDSLAESEMFGHVKGAFTGTDGHRIGIFEMAKQGTVLLDELADMKPEQQAKLLRVLDSGEVRSLGSSKFSYYNFRVIATLNRSPEDCLKQNLLREDLYYRIACIVLSIPPLRHRADEIVPLAQAVLADISKDKMLSSVALEMLAIQQWPGNVRQLIQSVKRAAIVSEGPVIGPEGFSWNEPVNVPEPIGALADNEKDVIRSAILRFGGNKSKTAKYLGIGRQTLYNKLKIIEVAGGFEVSNGSPETELTV